MGGPSRVGVLVPSVNTVVEDELPGALPNVGTSVGRIPLRGGPDLSDQLMGIRSAIIDEARKVADAGVQVIAVACGGATLVGNGDYDRQLRDDITTATGVPAITTTSAIVETLKAIGARSVAVMTPYPTWLHDRELDHFVSTGLKVVGLELGCGPPETLGTVASSRVAAAVIGQIRMISARPDAILISCANARTASILGPLSSELGVTVTSSNDALFRVALDIIQLEKRQP